MDIEELPQPTAAEMSDILEVEAQRRTREERIEIWRSILSSAYWRPFKDEMRRLEEDRDQRLRKCDGRDLPYEHRLRGAADAFAYVQSFMLNEVQAFDEEQKSLKEEAKTDAAARHFAEYGRNSPFPIPDNPE